MKLIFRPKYLLFGLVTGLIGLIAIPANGQEKTIKKVAVAPTTAVGGPALFKQYCAACHGTDGKGSGPAASALKAAPSDLTALAKQSGGHFPEERFMQILRGEANLAAHGSQDMPVWGSALDKLSPNPNLAQTRLHGLMEYVEGIQVK